MAVSCDPTVHIVVYIGYCKSWTLDSGLDAWTRL